MTRLLLLRKDEVAIEPINYDHVRPWKEIHFLYDIRIWIWYYARLLTFSYSVDDIDFVLLENDKVILRIVSTGND